MNNNKVDRVTLIKRRYGKNIFVKWGATGGNPVLYAQRAGKVRIIK